MESAQPIAIRSRAPRHARAVALLAWLPLAMVACSEMWDPIIGTRPENYQVSNPGMINASATGTGCGSTEREALESARKVAHYNLRSMTGNAAYNVEYTVLPKSEQHQNRVCVEVRAKAVP